MALLKLTAWNYIPATASLSGTVCSDYALRMRGKKSNMLSLKHPGNSSYTLSPEYNFMYNHEPVASTSHHCINVRFQ